MNIRASHHRDALIKRIDGAGKLPNLPKIAFDRLLNYRVRQAKLTDADMALLKKCESNQNLSDAEKTRLHQQLAGEPQMIAALPQKVRQLCQQQQNKTHAKVTEFLTEINKLTLPSAIDNAMPDYVTILNKIESNSNHKPSETELKKLDQLHDALKAKGKLHILPNQSQAVLENYRTEQELKGKFVNMPTNIQQLIRALENSQQLKPFQTIYLLRYFKKNNIKLASKQALQFHTAYERIDPNLIRLAEDMDDLIDRKMLEALGRVVTKIELEEKRHVTTYIALKDFGEKLKLTTAPGEQRLRKLTERNDIIQAFFKEMKTGNQNYNIADLKKLFRIHWGIDVQGYALRKDAKQRYNQLYYVPDSRMGNPNNIEANVIRVSKDSKKQEHSIYIVEANPDKGVLITIYRHVKNLHQLSVGKPNKMLNGETLLGTYQYPTTATDKIEHGHIDKLFMPKEQAADVLGKEANGKILSLADKDKIRNMINNFSNNSKKSVQNMEETRLKVVEAFDRKLDGADKEFVIMELFTPGTQLYNHYINEITSTWIKDAEDLYKHENILNKAYLKSGDDKKAAKDITGAINTYKELILLTKLTSMRNKQQLEVITKILIQAKLLLKQIGKTSQPLESTIQKSQKAAIDIREKLLSHGKEIKHVLQEILQNENRHV